MGFAASQKLAARQAEVAPAPSTPARPSRTGGLGNQALLRRLSSIPPRVQTKLQIGTVDDPLEHEADRVAEHVMRMPDPDAAATPPVTPAAHTVQRACTACEAAAKDDEEHPTLQRRAAEGAAPASGPASGVAPRSVQRTLASAGRPLSSSLRNFFEPRFGADLAQVRVHTDADADASARDVSAQAYTVGSHIVFARARYATDSGDGRRLLAHELTHVMQQTGQTNWVAPRVQRQEETDVPRAGGGPRLPTPDVVTDPTALSEPHCPAPPTRLGNLAPAPPCNGDGDDIDGDVFAFCVDSDVFSDPNDLQRLRRLVSSQPSGTSFHLRAYASGEGPGDATNADLYNQNLSCHRVNRTIRELINLGVQEQQIDAVAKGATERFGTGEEARPRNRIVVVKADPTPKAPRPEASGMTMPQIRDAARQALVGGDYPLAADAYFARWSCGRWRTLGEAVGRSTILIQGIDTTLGAGQELGAPSTSGENTIVLSQDIANATDPIGCAANRIADLTFHHASRPVLSNFADQHRGGMHLVFLAGLPECRIPLDPMSVNFNVHNQPAPVDPFLGFSPRCADQPLAGPLANQHGPATMETAPTFTASPPAVSSGASGNLVPSGGNPITVGVEPDAPFQLDATVTASGTPASIAGYEVGFAQTVMAETWINTHVDGRRERRRFPLPLRDGPPRGDPLSDPPWFDRNAKVTAQAGANQITTQDAPNFRAFTFLPDLPTTTFVESINIKVSAGGATPATLERPAFQRGLGPLLPSNASQADIDAEKRRREALRNNVPDRGQRVLDFNTWVVARKQGAPATQGATQFLAGLRMTFRMDVNWTTPAGGQPTGAGTYSLTSSPAGAADASAMMLRGATPLDFADQTTGVPLFAEFLDIDPPLPRAQAGGLARSAYFDTVRQLAQPLRTAPSLRGELILRINVETETGRVILDTPDLQRGAIRVIRPGPDMQEINTPEAQALARTIFPDIRKLIAAPGFAPNEPQSGTMPVAVPLSALP